MNRIAERHEWSNQEHRILPKEPFAGLVRSPALHGACAWKHVLSARRCIGGMKALPLRCFIRSGSKEEIEMTDHQLYLFLAEVTVLLLAARIGSEISSRLRLPHHVGELVMGLLIGPSFLGWIRPAAFHSLFPKEVLQRSLLDILSWTGIIFLVLIGGLETRLGILRRVRKSVVGGWIGGLGLPFIGGFALGMAFPRSLVPHTISQPLFALFLATAMSISAVPVIARILMDLDLYKTRMGMVILSTAIADDTIGWIVLAIVAGLAEGHLAAGDVLRTL